MAKRKVRKAQTKVAKVAKRNPVAQNPLLGKSEVHQKSDKAMRRAAKMQMRKEWYQQSTDEKGCVLLISLLFAVLSGVRSQQQTRPVLA